jgi:hypothetical protein
MRINYKKTGPTSVYHKRIIATTGGRRKGQAKMLLGYTFARFSGQLLLPFVYSWTACISSIKWLRNATSRATVKRSGLETAEGHEFALC